MATVKKGVLVKASEWWVHLRGTKRYFWKRHRRAERRLSKKESDNAENDEDAHRAPSTD